MFEIENEGALAALARPSVGLSLLLLGLGALLEFGEDVLDRLAEAGL